MAADEPMTAGAAGRLLGGDNLQRAVDATERTVKRLEGAVARIVPAIEHIGRFSAAYKAARGGQGAGGGGTGGGGLLGGQTPGSPNGGGATFGGVPHGAPPGGAAGGGGGKGGGGLPPAPGTPGNPQSPNNQPAGNGGAPSVSPLRSTVGALAAGAASVGTQMMQSAQNAGAGDKRSNALALSNIGYYSTGGNAAPMTKVVKNGEVTAMDLADVAQRETVIQATSGFAQGSAGWESRANQARGLAMLNPTISQGQAAQMQSKFWTPTTFNQLSRVGIKTMTGGTQKTVAQIANEVLGKTGLATKKLDIEEINFVLNDPMSNLNQTLDNWAVNGLIAPDQLSAIKEEMRGILIARSKGKDFKTYTAIRDKATAGDRKALAQMKDMGLASPLQTEKNLAAAGRRQEVQQMDQFVAGLESSTEALTDFKNMVADITSIVDPIIGRFKGQFSQGMGAGILGMIPGAGGLMSGLGSVGSGAKSLFGALSAPFGGSNESRMSVLAGGGADFGAGSGGGADFGAGSGGGFGGAHESRQSVLANNHMGRHSLQGERAERAAPARSSSRMIYPVNAPRGAYFGQKGSYWSSGYHTGQDFRCPSGTPVKAAASGTVTTAGYHSAYGNQVIIDHGGGLQTLYAHHSRLSVRRGAKVRQGQVVGYSGETGNTTGPHLHFEVRKGGSPVDPMPYLGGKKSVPGNPPGGSGPLDNPGNTGPSGRDKTDNAGTTGLGSGVSYSGGGGGSGTGLSGAYSEAATISAALSGGSAGPGTSIDDMEEAPGQDDFSGLGPAGTASGQVRSGTFNVYVGTSNQASQRDLTKVLRGADVLSLTEMIRRKQGLVPWLKKQGWGYFQKGGETGVAWDKSNYTMVRSGSRLLNSDTLDPKKPGATGPRTANYVLLKDRKTGQMFWQIAAHTVPLPGRATAGRRYELQQRQFAVLTDLVNDLEATGYPVILAGDLNDIRPNIGGMRSNWGKTGGHIDHVLFGKGMSALSSRLLSSAGLASDHPAVFSTISLGKGASNESDSGAKDNYSGGGSPSANQQLGKRMAAARGWTGHQWDALLKLWNAESGWRHTADNPSSSAYGIPQALIALHNMPKGYYARKSGSGASTQGYGGSPAVQIQWGLNYIGGRYGNPANAWSFHQSHNWYDKGAWEIKQDETARVHKGEMIIPPREADQIRDVLIRANPYGGARRGGEVVIEFKPGAIVVQVGSGGSRNQGRALGKEIVDAIAQDKRIRALQGGRYDGA